MSLNEQDQSSKIDQQHKTHSADYAPYPKIDPKDVTPPQETWSSIPVDSHPQPEEVKIKPPDSMPSAPPNPTVASHGLASEPVNPSAANSPTMMPPESNPYVSPSPVPASSMKNKMDSMKDMLGKFGKKAAETTKMVEVYAGDVWQHLKTSPNIADAAVGRIAQGTKVLAEGGYEKIFRQTFDTVPEEQLQKSYVCYLSTSSGPVMGILYLSTAKLAFCSDNPLSYTVGNETQWSYYKMVIPLQQLKAVNPSTSKVKPSEKYIQLISVDNHEFWFMGFVNYESATKNLQGVLQAARDVPVATA